MHARAPGDVLMRAANRFHHRHRKGVRAQSLAETALVLPLLLLIALGGTAVNSYVQAQNQLQQAVSRAALVAAREAFDPCTRGDEPGATNIRNFHPKTIYTGPGGSSVNHPYKSAQVPHGYQDVLDAFNAALTSPLFPNHTPNVFPINSNAKQLIPTITCTTADGTASMTTDGTGTVTGNFSTWPGWTGPQTANWTPPAGYASWQSYCTTSLRSRDGGCFAVWRGGTVTVSYKTSLAIQFLPIWNHVTISASAGEQIEPYREHICPGFSPGDPISDLTSPSSGC